MPSIYSPDDYERNRDAIRARQKAYYERSREKILAKKKSGSVASCPVCGGPKHRKSLTCDACFRAIDRANAVSSEKKLARVAVSHAIASGSILKPDSCSLCGEQAPLEAHHHNGYDDDHVLDVVFLCKPCHQGEHREAA